MSSQNSPQPGQLLLETARDVAKLGSRIQTVQATVNYELRHMLFEGLRAGVTVVIHSFTEWQKRSV